MQLSVTPKTLNTWIYLNKEKPCVKLVRLVECTTNITRPTISHFDRPCVGEHGSGCVCPVYGGSRSRCALSCILESQGTIPQGSNPPCWYWVYRLAPEIFLFRGMPAGPEAYLEPSGASAQRSISRCFAEVCQRTAWHPCRTFNVQWQTWDFGWISCNIDTFV